MLIKQEVRVQSKEDKLAETLRRCGFAFSAAQAKDMAKSIAKPNTKSKIISRTKKIWFLDKLIR